MFITYSVSPEAALLLVSSKNCNLLEKSNTGSHGLTVTLRMLRVKTDKSDWLNIKERNDFYGHAQKIRPSQKSQEERGL